MQDLATRTSRTVVLDLDGTLTDARPRQLATLCEAARELRLPCPDADAVWRRKRAGLSTREALRALDVPDPEAAALAARWVERVEDDDMLALDRPHPAAARALGLIGDAGAAAIVLTARRREAAVRSQVAGLFGDKICDVLVVAPGSVIAGKAAALRELAPVVGYVGDTEADAEAAGRADIPFAAVAGGQRDPDWLKARAHCAVYPDAADAVRALLQGRCNVDRVL